MSQSVVETKIEGGRSIEVEECRTQNGSLVDDIYYIHAPVPLLKLKNHFVSPKLIFKTVNSDNTIFI